MWNNTSDRSKENTKHANDNDFSHVHSSSSSGGITNHDFDGLRELAIAASSSSLDGSAQNHNHTHTKNDNNNGSVIKRKKKKMKLSSYVKFLIVFFSFAVLTLFVSHWALISKTPPSSFDALATYHGDYSNNDVRNGNVPMTKKHAMMQGSSKEGKKVQNGAMSLFGKAKRGSKTSRVNMNNSMEMNMYAITNTPNAIAVRTQYQSSLGNQNYQVSDNSNTNSSSTSKSNGNSGSMSVTKIPKTIIIVDPDYDSIHDIPHPYQQNIQHTIQTYHEFWHHNHHQTSTTHQKSEEFLDHYTHLQSLMNSKLVWYINDQECQRIINSFPLTKFQQPKKLLEYYKKADKHHKIDLCRSIALYQKGGLYFDMRLQVVKPIRIRSEITLMTTPFSISSRSSTNGDKMLHDPSFIASAPFHPLLQQYITNILLEEHNKDNDHENNPSQTSLTNNNVLFQTILQYTNMTPSSATDILVHGKVKYDHFNQQHNDNPAKDWILSFPLSEINLLDSSLPNYPTFPRRTNGIGSSCNKVIHDPDQKQIYFYSTIIEDEDYDQSAGKNNHLFCKYQYKIPHRLVFLDTRYTSIQNIPSPFQQNVLHTIQIYKDSWKDIKTTNTNATNTTTVEVDYLGDDECQKSIIKVEPRLLPHYLTETKGQNKANVCRIATLYDKGGYYFDTDMEVIEALSIQKDVTFVTPHEAKSTWHNVQGFFNSFVAVMPHHPLLRINLDIFIQYYESHVDKDKRTYKGQKFPLLGTASLYASYKEFQKKVVGFDIKNWKLDLSLVELRLSPGVYNKFPRQKGTGCCCNYVVHNQTAKHIYFYSRIVGAEPWCVSQ